MWAIIAFLVFSSLLFHINSLNDIMWLFECNYWAWFNSQITEYFNISLEFKVYNQEIFELLSFINWFINRNISDIFLKSFVNFVNYWILPILRFLNILALAQLLFWWLANDSGALIVKFSLHLSLNSPPEQRGGSFNWI